MIHYVKHPQVACREIRDNVEHRLEHRLQSVSMKWIAYLKNVIEYFIFQLFCQLLGHLKDLRRC